MATIKEHHVWKTYAPPPVNGVVQQVKKICKNCVEEQTPANKDGWCIKPTARRK